MTPENNSSLSGPVCKKVLALLTPHPVWDPDLCRSLEESFGSIDYRSAFFPFEYGGYYAAEMGGPLHRGWLSFRGTSGPQDLPAWKVAARSLEIRWSRAGKRTRNLDVGYLDADKVVLGSFKPGPRKIYMAQGVWADMVLGYSRGNFEPTPWTFPDFRSDRYYSSLGVVREKLKAEMRR